MRSFLLIGAVLIGLASPTTAQWRCGKDFGGATCADGGFPTYCCSAYGYCGIGDAWCGTGCQSGPCYSSVTTTTTASTTTTTAAITTTTTTAGAPSPPPPATTTTAGTPAPPSPPTTTTAAPPIGSVLARLQKKENVVVYWGQGPNDQRLSAYCSSPSYDIIIVSFLNEFPNCYNGLPCFNLAGHPWASYYTCDTSTPVYMCPRLGDDIKACQAAGKTILLSLGGAIGNYGFASASSATAFATTFWNMFMGGSGTQPRPFGTAVIDGLDLDIENNNNLYYATFVNSLRALMATDTTRTYIIGAAPQCVYPDASLGPGAGTALTDAAFDFVAVQFYNNPGCQVLSSGFNFGTWHTWAKGSKNPNCRIMVGVPASPSSAGTGFVTESSLEVSLASLHANTAYTNFGGLMMWEVSAAETYACCTNGGAYGPTIASFLHGLGSSTPACTTNADCSNGLFCDGAETCVSGACVSGSAPCTSKCNESTDQCVQCLTSADCNDNNACTTDTCSAAGTCSNALLVPCCGNNVCEVGESCSSCSADCKSGTINTAVNGNGICEIGGGESCLNSADCPGVRTGSTSKRYCCGNVAASYYPISCSNTKCGGPTKCTTTSTYISYCCGDGVCNGPETNASCARDCP